MSDRSDFERTAPHDISAEQIVLGAMMDPARGAARITDAVADVAEIITAGDYYRAAHQIVHEVVEGIARDPAVQLRSRPRRKSAFTADRLPPVLLALTGDDLRSVSR